MRKSYTTKSINRPEMKFYLVLDYTLPSTWPKSTQAEIQNDGGSMGLVISHKICSRLSHLIKRESLMFSIFTMIDSKFHLSPTFTSNLFFLNQSFKVIVNYFHIVEIPRKFTWNYFWSEMRSRFEDFANTHLHLKNMVEYLSQWSKNAKRIAD